MWNPVNGDRMIALVDVGEDRNGAGASVQGPYIDPGRRTGTRRRDFYMHGKIAGAGIVERQINVILRALVIAAEDGTGINRAP